MLLSITAINADSIEGPFLDGLSLTYGPAGSRHHREGGEGGRDFSHLMNVLSYGVSW